ncbi:transmembrane sensor [Parabacteroides sp. PF5-5]|uniref:FecR family protein n=1 Tax=unclassified Parabacteroides TaxID=2649774 RepID=UPI00247365DE|nr:MULTISPECIES: FecR family protein [unclassified Parabacteroides]MDH6305709.1 transmembrane sensor [Parabacteroides sp. PH5-39]MDH6316781.1 transmembrane sensor [Parabacteroides sp. PF5-13]MDH6320422.1 transmembrane sensor [Parabacteroides sp. PH5-13]MDH6324152.1 transmembrane sensor [Parabacteroides sp. PH5-8]MDH6327967.1 transmembrane sensor [Parabacteroides sp. PH5-41]
MTLNKQIDTKLLLKYINKTADAKEIEQVNAWLEEDKLNENTILQMAKIYHQQCTLERIKQRNSDKALRVVQQRIRNKSRRIFIQRTTVAASLLIGLLGIGSFLLQYRQEESPMITVSTNAGMRSQLTLPDNTIVYLNAASTITYPSRYTSNKREVQLSGEAYFKVVHDPARPFIVHTSDERVNVRVLGTEFTLQAYEKDKLIQATLVEGSVQVGVRGKKGSVLMFPDDKVTYDIENDKIYRRKVNTTQETAWMRGCLIFKDTPMPEVLRQLANFYSVEFNVVDEVIHNYTFTGAFENKPLFQILDYMKISSKINYVMSYPEDQDERKPTIKLMKIK